MSIASYLRRTRDAGLAILRMPWAGWKAMVMRIVTALMSESMSLAAAGCAFYATLALFPGISMLVFIYGMVFDPITVEPQLRQLRDLLPPPAFALIDDRVTQLVHQKPATLGIGLVISTLITLWSCSAGTKAMLSALNVAYHEQERRGFFRFQGTALAMTLVAIFGATLGVSVLVGIPAILSFIGLPSGGRWAVQIIGLIVLMICIIPLLSLLYRFGPSRTGQRWQWTTPGAVVSTLLWLVASALLTVYVGRLASYDVTYGPLAASVGVMMWFWVTTYVILLGAKLNAELERNTNGTALTVDDAPDIDTSG
jgi:membrane protein